MSNEWSASSALQKRKPIEIKEYRGDEPTFSADALAHHGIKGQKWGVRRFQNDDGSLTAAGKIRSTARNRIVRSESTTKDVEDIIGTMNKKEQQFVLAGSDHYLNVEERSTIAKRVVVRDKNGTPVSFFDLLEDGNDDLQVALGTRSGSEYRGKGYASKAAQEAINWVDRNQDKIRQKNLIWGVHVDNTGSIKIAEKNGFKLDKNSYSSDGKWVNYVRPVHSKDKMEHSDDNYLMHFGVKGQKHGRRQYQNLDGSLTPLGRIHYGVGQGRDRIVDSKQLSRCLTLAKRGRLSFDDIPDTETKQKYVKASERRAKASQAYDEMIDEFDKEGFDSYKKYATKSAEESWASEYGNVEKNEYGTTKREYIDWYIYDDGDQGIKTAIDYWAEDDPKRKARWEKVNKEYGESMREESDARDALVKDIVGNKSGQRVKSRRFKRDVPIDTIVRVALLDEEDRRYNKNTNRK